MIGLLAPVLLVAAALSPESLDHAVELARVHVQEMHASSGTPGVQVAAAVGGELVWIEGFGWKDLESRLPVEEDTRFGIGSITKTLTMAVCARLVDQGSLAWDEPVETYLAAFAKAGFGVTIRNIGAHLSGMADRPPDSAPLTHPPGEVHRYATYPFVVVVSVIEAVEEESFPAVVARELTGPLGLRDTVVYDPRETMPSRTLFYVPSEKGPMPVVSDASGRLGGTGYLSTARDLVVMAYAIVVGDFVSEASRTELLRDHPTNDGAPTFFGLGWRIGRTDEWGFFYGNSGGGEGIAASLLVIPKFEVVVAVVTNLTRAPAWPMALRSAEAFVEVVQQDARTVEPDDPSQQSGVAQGRE